MTREEFDESDFLTVCALRFDAYKYWETRCSHFNVDSGDLRVLTENLVKTREFFAEPLDNLAAFFALQRFLSKWGGEQLTEFSDEHIVFRQLFLDLYRAEIPVKFIDANFHSVWNRKYEPVKELLAAQIRRNFRRVGRGAKIKF